MARRPMGPRERHDMDGSVESMRVQRLFDACLLLLAVIDANVARTPDLFMLAYVLYE